MQTDKANIDLLCVNAIRFLAVDAIQKSDSGHPGLPMGAAPAAYVLWSRHLRFNPKNPRWFNRDRFVLSAGHGSMLQYALLHLFGFDSVSLEDIERFRQWGSTTPGHPENKETAGVEVTTGPLGQGIANAVGLAIAQAHLAARFNKDDRKILDHFTYALAGDGCMMEGISAEACSLAGHLGLGNLIVLYDDNRITIDGPTDLAFSEDVGARFSAYGWQVLQVEDGDTDLTAIDKAISDAKADTTRPSLIKIRSTIGYGSPGKAGKADCHGSPLGKEEVLATRKAMGWDFGPFEIPAEVLTHTRKAVNKGAMAENEWNENFDSYRNKYPSEALELENLISGSLPDSWVDSLPTYRPEDKNDATRGHSGKCLNVLAAPLAGILGGSADLAPSNKTLIKGSGDFAKGSYQNRNIRFGVREHAMGAICNGIALHGKGLIPYCATFLVFADYMRNAIRMSALSNAGVIYIMTHDSVAVGEDGPTHQPVEHIASLRAVPNLSVIRPADGNETSGAYKIAVMQRSKPTLLALSRQNVPNLKGTSVDAVSKGAYILSDPGKPLDLILIGTGAELALCADAAEKLNSSGTKTRVVSMPSIDLFEAQSPEYRESVLPQSVQSRLIVEAGVSFGWHKYAGSKGDIIAIDRFGASAPGEVCLEKFGYTVDNIVTRAEVLARK